MTTGSWASAERRAHLDRLLADLDARALLVVAESSRDPRLAPFVGPGRLGAGLVVWPRGGVPRLGYLSPMERGEAARSGLDLLTPEQLDIERLVREGPPPEIFLSELLERALHLSGLAEGTVAITGSQPVGEIHAALDRLGRSGWQFVPGEGLVDELRKQKGEGDLVGIREAADATVAAFRHVAHLLATAEIDGEGRLYRGHLRLDSEPLTVGHLKQELALLFAGRGLEQPERNIVAPAEEGAVPHNTGSPERVLRAGESLVVDLFPKGRLYADCTRTFCVGEPPRALADAHALALEALEAAETAARPGVFGWDLQESTCKLFREAGWPTPIDHPGTIRGYVHGLGHGVGHELHELPSFRRHASEAHGTLAVGDVITLEPGLYEPLDAPDSPGEPGAEPVASDSERGWAVRIEDLYVVVEDGVENLTPMPRALDPREW